MLKNRLILKRYLFLRSTKEIGLHTRSRSLSENDSKNDPVALSFCGAGFLGIYHVGVVSRLISQKERDINFMSKVKCYCGASSGSLAACFLATGVFNSEFAKRSKEMYMKMATEVQLNTLGVLSPKFNIIDHLKIFLENELPQDAFTKVNGKLHVSVTSILNGKNENISEFHSNEHLIQCLLASCCIPHVTGPAYINIGQQKYIDGGISMNMPSVSGHRIITISPFSGVHDISPFEHELKSDPSSNEIDEDMIKDHEKLKKAGIHMSIFGKMDFKIDYSNMKRILHTMSPPTAEQYTTYYHNGIRDADLFMKKEYHLEKKRINLTEHDKHTI